MADTNTKPNSEYDIHTKKYTKLLKLFIKHTETSNNIKNTYKIIFFWIIIGTMLTLMILFGISIFKAFHIIKNVLPTLQKGSTEITASVIATVISSFVTMLVAILNLPKIIAKYLFNAEEDKSIVQIIEEIQKYDTSMFYIEKDIEYKLMKQKNTEETINKEENSVLEFDETPNNPDVITENLV